MDKLSKFADRFKLADLQDYKILGEFNYENYLLKLNCTFEEYMEDFVVFDTKYKSQGNVRTFFHELIHFFQYSTTPIGNYLLQLSNFQTLQAELIVRNLDRIEYPLIPYIKKHVPVESKSKVWYHLRYWFLCELMRLYYTGDLVQLINISKATTFLEEGLTDMFLELEREICKVRKLNFSRRSMDNTHDHERMLMEQTLAITSLNVNVFENHARISEYWWDVAGDKEKYYTNQDLFEYSGWILAYKKVSNADTFEQFVSTFSAISELSLFSTILPCDNGLSSMYSAFDFAPSNRMYELISKSKKIKPVQHLNDYNRYIKELSSVMGYPSVESIANSCMLNYKQSPGISYIEKLFITSQKIRSENFSTFFNQGLWHSKALEIEPYSSYFTQTFIPPAIQFKDIIKFHKDKEILFQLFSGYCFRSYLRELLTGCSKKGKANLVPVESPYRMSPDDLIYWQSIIQQYLNNLLGFRTNINLY